MTNVTIVTNVTVVTDVTVRKAVKAVKGRDERYDPYDRQPVMVQYTLRYPQMGARPLQREHIRHQRLLLLAAQFQLQHQIEKFDCIVQGH